MCSSNIRFETYKLHAELAERVADTRESLNRLYSGMVVGLIAGMVLVNRIQPGTEMTWLFYGTGVAMSITWLLSMHSVRCRLKAKHDTLVLLENDLPFDFLRQEEKKYEERRWKLRRSRSGMAMPSMLLVYCVWQLIQSIAFCVPDK